VFSEASSLCNTVSSGVSSVYLGGSGFGLSTVLPEYLTNGGFYEVVVHVNASMVRVNYVEGFVSCRIPTKNIVFSELNYSNGFAWFNLPKSFALFNNGDFVVVA